MGETIKQGNVIGPAISTNGTARELRMVTTIGRVELCSMIFQDDVAIANDS